MYKGILPRYHILVRLVEAAVLLLSGVYTLGTYRWFAWNRTLFDFCETLFTVGGKALYRLYLGRPPGMLDGAFLSDTVLKASDSNLVGPSVSTLYNYKLKCNYQNGLLLENAGLFRDILLSTDPPAIGFRDDHCRVVLANLQADETPVAAGAWVVQGKTFLGSYWPIPTLAELRQKAN